MLEIAGGVIIAVIALRFLPLILGLSAIALLGIILVAVVFAGVLAIKAVPVLLAWFIIWPYVLYQSAHEADPCKIAISKFFQRLKGPLTRNHPAPDEWDG